MVVVRLAEVAGRIDELWSPRVIASLNDYSVKVARIQGEFVWHKHEETDELFLVLSGQMVIQHRTGEITLKEGDLAVVPKGLEHRPVTESECLILLIEPAGTRNTGDVENDMTVETDRWY